MLQIARLFVTSTLWSRDNHLIIAKTSRAILVPGNSEYNDAEAPMR
jgi:hypothetical protein